MNRNFAPERTVDKILDVIFDQQDFGDSVAQLVHNLLGDGLCDGGRGFHLRDDVIGMCQRRRKKEVVSFDGFRDSRNYLLSKVFK